MTLRHDTYADMHTLLRNIKLGDPNISEADSRERLWEAVSECESKRNAWKHLKRPMQFFRLLVDNWHLANWGRYEAVVENETVKINFKGRQSGATTAQRKVVAQRTIAASASVILLNLPMPNSKLLRDCTGADCAKFGGWFGEISRRIGATQVVGKQLTETDLHNLYSRNQPRGAVA